jgi:hypothetical protein
MYWLRVNIAETALAASIFDIVHVAAVGVPPFESHCPDHTTADPESDVAVSVTAVPELSETDPPIVVG